MDKQNKTTAARPYKLPKAFVISLKSETKRREYISSQFDSLGISFKFFDAVDARDFDVTSHKIYNKRRRLYFGKDLTGGELGCLLSHRAVLQKMVKEDIEKALIFEDDVILKKEFPKVVEALAASEYKYDLVRFLGSPKVARLRQRKIFEITTGFWLTRLSTSPGGAHAYLIRKSGAKKLLKHLEYTMFPIDALMGRPWQTGIGVFTVQPGLATQNLDLESSIGEERFKKDKKQLSGIAKTAFPITRGWFKLGEAVGKRYCYISTLLPDWLAKD